MKKEYDLSKMTLRPNPYFAARSTEITLRVGQDVVAYFDALSAETGVEPGVLMATYLRECALVRHRPQWGLGKRPASKRG